MSKAISIWPRGVWAVLALVLLAGCEKPPQREKAVSLVEDYYAALQADELEKAADILQGENSQAQWLNVLESTREDQGSLEDYEISRVTTRSVFRGRFYIIDVDARYTSGVTRETLTVFQPVREETVEIVARKLDQ